MPNPTYNRLDDNGLLYVLTLLKPIIQASGDTNIIEVVQKNGVALTVNNKTVNVEVPTTADIQGLISTALANTGDPYQTESDVDDAIQDAIAGISGLEFEIVQSLPQTGQAGVIYLLSNSGTAPNVYDEYIWINNTFEKIGSTAVDLSGYVQAAEMHALTNAEIDTIFGQVWT